MTDRLKGCWVSFDHDIRDDDAEPILEAIRMIRGVAAVEPSVADSNDWMAREHVKQEVRDKILNLLRSI